jgi:sporulation protein YlmC with PRC-barrel domain
MKFVARKAAASAVPHPEIWYTPDRNRGRRVRAGTFGLVALAVLLMMLVLVAVPKSVRSQAVALVKVDVSVVAKGLRASKVIGTGVVNDKNEKIGTLDDIILDGPKAAYAVLQVGGFLGIGSRLVAIPYESLKVTEDGRRIELPGATKDELNKLTEYKHRTS